MIKNTLLGLSLLLLASPVLALPTTCSCVYCGTHQGSSCTAPGSTVMSCSRFLTRCATPGEVDPLPPVEGEQFRAAALFPEIPADTAQSCR
jgi:hypothetical protein